MIVTNNNEFQMIGTIVKRLVLGKNYYVRLDSDRSVYLKIKRDPFRLLDDGDKISIRSKLTKEKITGHVHLVANVFYFDFLRR